MIWIKTFHIVFTTSWFAGLFYLPRIYVNLAQTTNPTVYSCLLGMAKRLLRFTTILAVPAMALGIWLFWIYGIGYGPSNGWMHAKILGVLAVLGYHYACYLMLRKFAAGKNKQTHVFYRCFNEVPIILLVIIAALVVVKPF